MILWRNIENYPFYHFDSDPRFPPFLLHVRWKSGVTLVWRCFRDVKLSLNMCLICSSGTFGFVKVPVNNFSVMSGQSHHFLGITSTFWRVNLSLLKDTALRR